MGDLNATSASPLRDGLASAGTVLVTGAEGFLGRHVLHALAELQRANPSLADKHPAASETVEAQQASMQGVKNHPRIVATYLPNGEPPVSPGAEWLPLDVTDHAAMRTLLERTQPDIIIHLAAAMGGARSRDFAERAFTVNTAAAHQLMLTAVEALPQLRRLVLIGTAEEYGNAGQLPVTEEAPVQPVSPYSASKAAATQFALLYHRLFELPVTVLRPFIVYGPGQTPSMMLPQLFTHVVEKKEFPMTAGEQTRDFVHVDDVADAVLRAAVVPAAPGEVFNVCSGTEHSIRSIAEEVVRISGGGARLDVGALPYRRSEVMRIVGSFQKARHLLGWQPRIELQDGLARTIDWYRQQQATTA